MTSNLLWESFLHKYKKSFNPKETSFIGKSIRNYLSGKLVVSEFSCTLKKSEAEGDFCRLTFAMYLLT